MSIPLPPDPYEALGLDRTCDADTIKKAHRKLALKHHPDRIKDPSLVEHNKNEFQKVQQAYEVLIDPARRSRYDAECRLAQLRKEQMADAASAPRQTYTKTTYTTRAAPAPTPSVPREYSSEPRYAYEERVPDSPYVETSRGFEDAIPRANARKVDPKTFPEEKRAPASKPAERKEKPKYSGWEKTGGAMKMAMNMKAKAEGARSRVAQKEKEKEKEKEEKAQREKEQYAKAKSRDKAEAQARDLKNANRRPQPFNEDDSANDSSGSDADTIRDTRRGSVKGPSPIQKTRRAVTPEPPKSRRQPSPPRSEVRMPRQQSPRAMPRSARQSSPRLDPRWAGQSSPRPARTLSPQPMRSDQRSAYDDDDEEDSEDEKYKRQFRHAQGYQNIAARKDPRPTPSRQGSDIREYWQAEMGRKSGSDSDKRSSNTQKPSRRSMPDESRLRPPLPTQTSAPAGVRNAAATSDDPRAKPRSRQNSYASNSQRREIPELKRSGSEPGPNKGTNKRDGAPMKGSSLKQTESAVNHDSGYGSSSSPQTPENRGDSPPREIRPRETSTKYSVKRDEDTVRARKMVSDDSVPLSKFLSPQDTPAHHLHNHHPESRDRRSSRSRDRDRDRDRDYDDRRRSTSSSHRVGNSERRSSFSRNESSSRYDDREKSRNVRMERSPNRNAGYFRWEGEIKQTRPKAPTYSSAYAPSMSKFYEGSTVSRNATARRPSVC